MQKDFMDRLMECDHSLIIEEMTNVAWGDMQQMEREQCELDSEIERLMFVALLGTTRALHKSTFMPVCGLKFSISKRAMADLLERHPGYRMFVCPQMRVEDFRVDFGIVFANADGRMTGYAIECDGHEFHEKTKEQARRDKSRDRELMRSGLKVMRFTGSEIWHDPFKCAVDALHDAEADLIDVMYEESRRDAA